MFSTNISNDAARRLVIPLSLALGAAAFAVSPAHAQDFLGIAAGAERIVCVNGSGNIYVINSSDDCKFDDPANVDNPTGLQVANATFNETTNSTTFIGGTVQVNAPITITAPSALNATTTFGATATFNFGTTFNALADFNNGITSNTITNSGTISTATLSAGTIVGTSITASGSLLVSPSSTIDMGNNQIHGVAAGTADTDAVNVAQLNAATSGITADVTALEATTATHTTQIATLETTTATHTTQIAAIEEVNTTQATQISDIQTVNTTQATHITNLQTTVGMQATQITALQAADAAFATQIDELEATLGERIGKVDDRASAGTAAAVALSGAMFLPGKSFNLTGNVGSYRGAHAAALQFGAPISDNMAFNAGVAHGFNKGGKTALRAGFTLGW